MFVLCIIFGILLLLYVYLTWDFDYWSKRGVSSAKAKVLFGNLPSVITRKNHMSSDFEKLYNEFKGKTPFVGIFQIHKPRLLLLEPEIIKDVNIRYFKNFHDNEFGDMVDKDIDPLFGRNPFMLKGEEWKEKRAEITPAFTTSRLKALYPLIDDVKVRMVKYIREQSKLKEPLEARELCAKFTTDVVANAIFGVDAESFTKDKSEFREVGRQLIAPTGIFIFKIFLVSAIPLLKRVVELRFTHKDVEKFFLNLMDQALKYRKENNIQREDFLDYLIHLKKKKNINNVEMTAHTISFFTDGFETSSVAIAHTLYELAKDKRVQEKLREEINKHCGQNGDISFETLHEISYLEQVFNEGLRMHPPGTFTSRVCTKSVELEHDGCKAQVEKGMNVYIPILQLHYDPEFYDEPEKFMPERFDPEHGGVKAYKDKGVFLPFGDGPRMCLGIKFAQAQSLSAIASIIQNFELTVHEKTPNELVLDPHELINIKVGGFWLNFKPIIED